MNDGADYMGRGLPANVDGLHKVVDSYADAGQTLFRPAIGGALGVAFAGEAGVDQLDEVLSGGTAGGTALASHAVKAGLRLGINASPEPVSNIIASVTEDGLVAAIVVQGGIGYWQYFTRLPAALVGAHIAGATLVWIAVLRLDLAAVGISPLWQRRPKPLLS